MTDVIGNLAGVETVKQATIQLLATPPAGSASPLIVYYLAAVERQAGLEPQTLPSPPAPESFYGGVDFESWAEDLLPSIIVVAAPVDNPERFADGTIGQWFELQIAAIVQGDNEDDAQMIAGHYGTAIMGAVLQNGDLGGLANGTDLTDAPKVSLVDETTSRLFAMSILTVRSYLDQIVDSFAAPTTWPSDAYTAPAEAPTVESVGLELELMDVDEDLSDATFTGDDTIDADLT